MSSENNSVSKSWFDPSISETDKLEVEINEEWLEYKKLLEEDRKREDVIFWYNMYPTTTIIDPNAPFEEQYKQYMFEYSGEVPVEKEKFSKISVRDKKHDERMKYIESHRYNKKGKLQDQKPKVDIKPSKIIIKQFPEGMSISEEKIFGDIPLVKQENKKRLLSELEESLYENISLTKQKKDENPVFKKREEAKDVFFDELKLNKTLKKTSLCRSFIEGVKCPHSKCRFAHSLKELKKRDCLYGDTCILVKKDKKEEGVYHHRKGKRNICAFWHQNETKDSYIRRVMKTEKKV
jgi:hypothetical protein